MAKRVNHGKTEQILEFIREFCASHGFGPTIREIGMGVGLQSTSTVAGYLSRMGDTFELMHSKYRVVNRVDSEIEIEHRHGIINLMARRIAGEEQR